MQERQSKSWKIVRAQYAESDKGEFCKDDKSLYGITSLRPGTVPVSYTIDGDVFSSLEELALRLEIDGDESELYLDMNDAEIRKLCDIRRKMLAK